MKAIHGGKAKNNKVDSHKIASLARGGTFPMAFVYPRDMRATRDLLRRRMHLMRKRAELLCHIHNTNTQYNYDRICKNLKYKSNRKLIDDRSIDPSVQKNVDLDIQLIWKNFYQHSSYCHSSTPTLGQRQQLLTMIQNKNYCSMTALCIIKEKKDNEPMTI